MPSCVDSSGYFKQGRWWETGNVPTTRSFASSKERSWEPDVSCGQQEAGACRAAVESWLGRLRAGPSSDTLRIQAAGAHSRLPKTFPIFLECLRAPGSSAHTGSRSG